MTNTRKLELLAFAAAILLCLVFGRGWILSREAAIRADATAHQDQAIIQAREEAIQSRDAEAKTYAAAIAVQSRSVQTPQQAARVILSYAPPAPPGTPAPQIVTIDRAQLPADVQKEMPDAPTVSIVAPSELQRIARDELACDADRHTLATCQADAADLRTELAAETRTADTWKATAKGGTKWQRFGRVVKFAACAGAGAGVATLAHKSPQTAALGATAGVVGCSLF